MKAFSAIMGTARCRAHQPQEAFTMRTFTPPADTRFYAGVDLHARTLFLVILDGDGQVRFARNLPASPDGFLRVASEDLWRLTLGSPAGRREPEKSGSCPRIA
jgi:hypothetical protein